MNNQQTGFTLLEAIIALVLISVTGIALLNWINTNLVTLKQLQKTQQRQLATRNALEFIETINPEEKPQGEAVVGIYTFKWEAQVLNPKKGGTGFFLMSLYETKVQVWVEEELMARFHLHQVGFEPLELPDYYF